MDVSLPENAGLKIVEERLDKISHALGFYRIASKADIYAMAATVAAEVGFEEAAKRNTLCALTMTCIPMKWGRLDAKKCSTRNASAQ